MTAPEEIRGWRQTQLSIARFYGGCAFNGHLYEIDENDNLVRVDVLRKRRKESAERNRLAAKAERDKFMAAQSHFDILDASVDAHPVGRPR